MEFTEKQFPTADDSQLKGYLWKGPSGQPGVCMVHGGPGLFGYMRSLAEEFAEKEYTVCDYYQRNGQVGPISVDSHVSDLSSVAQEMKNETGEKPIALGHSWGGILSLLTQAERDCFQKIVLVNPMPFDAEGVQIFSAEIDARLSEEERELREERMQKLLVLEEGSEKENLFSQMSDDIYKTYQWQDRKEPFSELLEGVSAGSFFATHASFAEKMTGGLVEKEISKVKVPVHLIYGDTDPCPGAHVVSKLGELLSDFRVEKIEKCGHYPWLEPETTWAAAKKQIFQAVEV